MKLECGSEVVKPPAEREKILKANFGGFDRLGCNMVMPGEFLVTDRFSEAANEMYNFPVCILF